MSQTNSVLKIDEDALAADFISLLLPSFKLPAKENCKCWTWKSEEVIKIFFRGLSLSLALSLSLSFALSLCLALSVFLNLLQDLSLKFGLKTSLKNFQPVMDLKTKRWALSKPDQSFIQRTSSHIQVTWVNVFEQPIEFQETSMSLIAANGSIVLPLDSVTQIFLKVCLGRWETGDHFGFSLIFSLCSSALDNLATGLPLPLHKVCYLC